MRHDTPTPRGRRAGLVAVAAAALLLTACSGARPTTSSDPTVGDPTAAVTAAPTVPAATPSPAPAAAPAATVAPSGDADLDQLDNDLSAFEQENSGLDQAAAATQEK